jgi:hypothetical protein
MKKIILVYLIALTGLFNSVIAQEKKIWTAEQANQWYAKQPWLVGANFLPSSAINQLEIVAGRII